MFIVECEICGKKENSNIFINDTFLCKECFGKEHLVCSVCGKSYKKKFLMTDNEIICENCKGYYKLQPGEKQDDFNDRCACGGKLRYAIDIEVVGNQQLDHYYNSRQSNEKQSEKGIPPNNDPFNNNDKKK